MTSSNVINSNHGEQLITFFPSLFHLREVPRTFWILQVKPLHFEACHLNQLLLCLLINDAK